MIAAQSSTLSNGTYSPDHLQEWLSPLDSKYLECDGMSRVISTLLLREGVAHRVHMGALTIPKIGRIPMHYWCELEDGDICDFRARMWLGDRPDVPHGVFAPRERFGYESHLVVDAEDFASSRPLFEILTGIPLDSFPKLPTPT